MRSWRQATETSLRLLLDCLSQSGVEHEVSARVRSPCSSVAIIEAGAELCCLPVVANKSCSFSESERGEWATSCRRALREQFSALSCSSSACWSCVQHTTSSTLQAPSYITVSQSQFSVASIVSIQNKAPWIMQILVHKAFLSLPTAVLPSNTSGLHPQQPNVLVATEGYHDCHCQHVCKQNR